MTGLGRVHKHGRGSGGGEGGRNLAANVATFAHAHDYHAPAHGQHRLHGFDKGRPEQLARTLQGFSLNFQGLAREVQHLLRLVGG